jgi:predicted nuclease of predicted toxin-antitoxin system
MIEKLLADEDVPRPVMEGLRQKGFSIKSIDEEFKSIQDKDVIKKSSELELPILTFDSDFLKDRDQKHKGVLYVTKRLKYGKIIDTVEKHLEQLEKQQIENQIVMVSPKEYSK